MNKKIDAVKLQREIRFELGKKYHDNPQGFIQELSKKYKDLKTESIPRTKVGSVPNSR